MKDVLFSGVIIVVVFLFALLLTRRFKVSIRPFVYLAPIFIAVGLLTQISGSPFFTGLNDGLVYRIWGYEIADSWSKGSSWSGRTIWPGKGTWPVVIALISSITGPTLVSLVTLNALALAFSAIFAQKTTSLIFGKDAWGAITLLMLSNPSILLFGPTLLREAIFWLSITMGVTALAFFFRDKPFVGIGLIFSSSLGILAIRPNLGVILVYAFLFSAIIIWFLIRFRTGIKVWLPVLILTATLATTFAPAFSFLTATEVQDLDRRVTGFATAVSQETDYTRFLNPKVEGFTHVASQTESVCDQVLTSETMCQAVKFLPHVMFGPFWWEFQPRWGFVVSLVSTYHLWLLLVASSFSLVRRPTRNVATVCLFFMSLLTLLAISTVVSSYIIAIRFRTLGGIFLLPLAAAFLGKPHHWARTGSFRGRRKPLPEVNNEGT